ncbi:MAG: hypothetical protein RR014_01720, partial [Bilophila sp.]
MDERRFFGVALILAMLTGCGAPDPFATPPPEPVSNPTDVTWNQEQKGLRTFIEAEKDFDTPQNFVNLHYYLANRLMVDLNLNEEQLIQEFMQSYY